ncbi:thioredoxin [Bacillus coahuilensis p1.1.43]|uniref:Thioredoxin n=1 Tax=Bacillus coahuilensis p1.1.43 TaxID=1150625 RepID=A0A147K5S7_9BACI|nr:thioredoxin family protein [Bacillus coahuilensis]KUP05148.1 thioredoxin [Bacillus coahuilensis p1.1.43]
MSALIEVDKKTLVENIQSNDLNIIYFYTTMCGTCQMASKMLEVVAKTLPHLQIQKGNLNYMEDLAEHFQVQSVPCLIIEQEGKLVDKVYAFNSVPFLFDKLKQV